MFLNVPFLHFGVKTEETWYVFTLTSKKIFNVGVFMLNTTINKELKTMSVPYDRPSVGNIKRKKDRVW